MASPFDVEPPRWLEAQSARYAERPGQWGSLLGTALAGGVNALTQKVPETDAEGNHVIDKNGQPAMRSMSFIEGLNAARMNQADPLWNLRVSQIKSQIAASQSLTSARWMDADRKSQQAQWLMDSADQLQGWNPLTDPVPSGLAPQVAAVAQRQRAAAVAADLKSRDLETKLKDAESKIAAREQSLGIRETAVNVQQQRADIASERTQLEQRKFDESKRKAESWVKYQHEPGQGIWMFNAANPQGLKVVDLTKMKLSPENENMVKLIDDQVKLLQKQASFEENPAATEAKIQGLIGVLQGIYRSGGKPASGTNAPPAAPVDAKDPLGLFK